MHYVVFFYFCSSISAGYTTLNKFVAASLKIKKREICLVNYNNVYVESFINDKWCGCNTRDGNGISIWTGGKWDYLTMKSTFIWEWIDDHEVKQYKYMGYTNWFKGSQLL